MQILIHFGEGNDTLSGGSSGGTARGEGGDDRMWMTAARGTLDLHGADGNDDIGTFSSGGNAVARSYGGARHDTLRESNSVNMIDSWYGGNGFDVIIHTGGVGLAPDLAGAGSKGGATGSTCNSIGRVAGASGNDSMTGNPSNNLLIGNQGSDFLSGARGK